MEGEFAMRVRHTRLSQLLSLYNCINYGQTVQNAARSGRSEIFDPKLKKGLERHEMNVENVGKHFCETFRFRRQQKQNVENESTRGPQ